MEHLHDSVEAKMLRKEAIIVSMLIHIEVGFYCCDDVSIFQQSIAMQEHVRPGPRVVEDVPLGKEPEVQFVASAKFQNIRISDPPRLFDRDCGVKSWDSKLQDTPEEIVAIL